MTLTALLALMVLPIRAQLVVSDPSNLAQSIANTTREIIYTSKTAEAMLENFKETVRIYEQGKEYFDALRNVNDLVRSARKVQSTVLLVEEISDCYINGFKGMLKSPEFTSEELSAFGYARLMEESVDVLKDLRQVVSLTTLRMNDKERLDVVDDCYDRLVHLRKLVDYYTRKNNSVALMRAKSKASDRDFIGLIR